MCMSVPGRVREHLQLVPVALAAAAGGRIRRMEGPLVLPDALPLRFDLVRFVSRCVHDDPGYKKASRVERPWEARRDLRRVGFLR